MAQSPSRSAAGPGLGRMAKSQSDRAQSVDTWKKPQPIAILCEFAPRLSVNAHVCQQEGE